MAPWLKADWPAPTGVVAGTSLRTGGVSTGTYNSLNLGAHVGDKSASVEENRRRFRKACDLPQEPAWLSQVHGTRVIIDPIELMDPPEADAVLGRGAGTVCAILTADCLPVLFASQDDNEVAAAHAGWRGLLNGVLEATVSAMTARPGRILAWLGPAISQASFEVGPEVRAQFCNRDAAAAVHFAKNARNRWQADLYGLARQRLQTAGLRQVYGGGLCTYADPQRFFSFRRDGECGRMCSFVYRNPP
jgi:YfiH family protein